MISMTLQEIAEASGGELRLAGADTVDTVLTGTTTTDSREIEPGDIFVAKPGEFTDGHLFAPTAVERGASLLIVEHHLDLPVSQIVVGDAVLALGAFATEVVRRVRTLRRLKIIGITGSNGKTTSKNLLRAIVEKVGPTIAPRASFNNEVGAPLTFLRLQNDTEFLVAEMGASAIGEIASLVAMAKPDIGVVLNVGLAHAGEFGGIESTVIAKTEMVAELTAEDTAVLNIDDPRVAQMAEKTAANVVWFGQGPGATVRASEVHASAAGTSFTLTLASGESRPVAFRVLGEHHVMNALAAAASAELIGVSIDDIVSALESVQTAERWRMEVLGGKDGITVINDAYNASPDSMAAALRTVAQIATPGQHTIAVLGEMSELGEFSGEEHDRIGLMTVRLNISQLIVVGAAARRLHISAIKEGSWDGESLYFDTPDEAYELLKNTVQPGDLLLVKSSNSAGLRFLGDKLGELFSW